MMFNPKTFAAYYDQNENRIHHGYLLPNCGMQIVESCDITNIAFKNIAENRENIADKLSNQSANRENAIQNQKLESTRLDFSRNDIVFSMPISFQMNYQLLSALVQSDELAQKRAALMPSMKPLEFYGLMTISRQGQVGFYMLETHMPVHANNPLTKAVQKAINYLLEMAQKANQDENQVRILLQQIRESMAAEDKKSQKRIIDFLEELKRNLMTLMRLKKNQITENKNFIQKLHASFMARIKTSDFNQAVENILIDFPLEEIKKYYSGFLNISESIGSHKAAAV